MNPLIAYIIVGLAGFALAESPVSTGYAYPRPPSASFGGGGGGVAPIFSIPGNAPFAAGGYVRVPSGPQTNEGASVDGTLLEEIRQILLKEELQSQQAGGFGGGGYAPSSSYGAPSPQYGAPSPQYGVPNYQTRVVGIDLEGIRQAIQVAQFNQISQGPGGYSRGPSTSYGTPNRPPSNNYGAPF